MIRLTVSEFNFEYEDILNGVMLMNPLDYEKIEKLAFMAKNGSGEAKEELIEEFKPFIYSICRNNEIYGYDFDDKVSECHRTLFKCLKIYKPEKHRFVAYSIIAMRTSIKYLKRTAARRDNTEGISALKLNDCLEQIIADENFCFEDRIFEETLISKLKEAVKNLSEREEEIIHYIYMEENSTKNYADYKRIPYQKAIRLRNKALKKLRDVMDKEEYDLFKR